MANILAPNFVNVSVNLPAIGVTAQSFNVGLIVGQSTVISPTTRVAVYSSLAEMATAGFSLSSPEYLAATLYFGQTPKPTKLCVGRRDTGETPVQALQACRNASGQWYMAYDSTATDSDQAAVAAYVETLTSPFSQYILNSNTAAIRNGTAGNLFLALEALGYRRTSGIFSSTPHAAASVMGYAMGQTSNFANSNYTLKFKQLPGVTPEDLTESQVANIENASGNVYVNRGAAMYEQGQTFSGQFFDEVIGLDMIANSMAINAINALLRAPSLPQTEGGMAILRGVIGQACEAAVTRGFLAPGLWTGQPILSLNTGDPMAAGYVIMSDAISDQSDTDRATRVAPPIYACVKEAGAIHSTTIALNVNR